jgi:hypothetical protein
MSGADSGVLRAVAWEFKTEFPRCNAVKEKGKVMENPIATSVPELMASSAKIKGAIEDLGEEIPLVVNTAANFGADAEALTTARNNYEQGKVILATGRATLAAILIAVRVFLTLGRDVLKPLFGTGYSEAFDVLGYTNNSLKVPLTAEELLPMLQAYKAFYVANPLREDASNNLTAAHAQLLDDQLNAAENNVSLRKAQFLGLRVQRDGSATQLRKRIRDVMKELEMRLSPLDGRWIAFGFNLPGAEATPESVSGIEATLIGANSVGLKWGAAARAGYYRVWFKVHGSDQDYTAAGSPADLDFTLENLPANTAMDIAVSAVNDGGESALSAPVTITTH